MWLPSCVCLCVCLLPCAAKFEVEGVDMLLFNDEGKISTIVQFDMQVSCGRPPYGPRGGGNLCSSSRQAPAVEHSGRV